MAFGLEALKERFIALVGLTNSVITRQLVSPT